MLTYSQSSGEFYIDVQLIDIGYSGKDPHKNLHKSESIKNYGPIPAGIWEIGASYNSKKCGRMCIILKPMYHDAHGRTNFLIHGDSIKNPGTASSGCIILGYMTRKRIIEDKHRYLLVTR